MGRYPVGPGQTRRPDRHHWRRLEPTTAPTVPPMPERDDGREWTPEAIRAWREWWSSPVRGAWIACDEVALRRAVRLVDDIQRGRRGLDGALLALLDRLGLTPAGRLRLQWLIEPHAVAAVEPAPRSDDPRLA
jgi:hypothetical protein